MHYGEAARLAVDEVASTGFALVERLAGHLCDVLLVRFPRLDAVTVTVHKPHAPVDVHLRDVAVTLRRGRR